MFPDLCGGSSLYIIYFFNSHKKSGLMGVYNFTLVGMEWQLEQHQHQHDHFPLLVLEAALVHNYCGWSPWSQLGDVITNNFSANKDSHSSSLPVHPTSWAQWDGRQSSGGACPYQPTVHCLLKPQLINKIEMLEWLSEIQSYHQTLISPPRHHNYEKLKTFFFLINSDDDWWFIRSPCRQPRPWSAASALHF